jgi:hypothetical protein
MENNINDYGFIILRNVINEKTNQYWNLCYDSIRKFYPDNNILIIDDNSDYKYINDRELFKVKIINSEYPRRGELLPYYYYLKNKLFDIAIILHDSVFINQYIDFKVNNYKMIWEFGHNWDQEEDEIDMIKIFNDNELIDFYKNKNLWTGCFGSMSIITYEYLTLINNKYDISLLLDKILNRYNRCSFERVIAVLLQKNYSKTTLLGDISKYCRYGVDFDKIDYLKKLPIIKIWTGR